MEHGHQHRVPVLAIVSKHSFSQEIRSWCALLVDARRHFCVCSHPILFNQSLGGGNPVRTIHYTILHLPGPIKIKLHNAYLGRASPPMHHLLGKGFDEVPVDVANVGPEDQGCDLQTLESQRPARVINHTAAHGERN